MLTITVTKAGAIPSSPTVLLAEELAAATALSPGLTANLVGSLVEDLSSTATGAVVVINQAVVDLINSISPYVSNPALLYQLGAMYGVQQGIGSNTSVYVTFLSSTNIDFIIPAGLIVSDGTNQFITQSPGVIKTGGQSEPIFCVALNSGVFSVPTGTVTSIISSLPSNVTMTCINQVSGIQGTEEQTIESYRAQVIQAGQATAQGVPQFLKTQLQKVNGVIPHLVSFRPIGANSEIICGGGDPFAVAAAIYNSGVNLGTLIGSTMIASSITNAYPAVVTTNIANNGYSDGSIISFTGALGMSGLNGNQFYVTTISGNSFNLNVNIDSISWLAGTVTVVTSTPHGIPAGTISGQIFGVLPIAYNGSYTFTQVDAVTFTYPLVSDPGVATQFGYTPFDSIALGAYTADSATITPNLRNITVDINDSPDVYPITFVNPPSQNVIVNLTWNTTYTNLVPAAIIDAKSVQPIVDYINNIGVGQPINIFDLQTTFQNAVEELIPPHLISKMLFSVAIDGIITPPDINTGVIYGDPESYFLTNPSGISIAQA